MSSKSSTNFNALSSPNVNDPIYIRAQLISKAFENEIIKYYNEKKTELGFGVLFINCAKLKFDNIDISSNEPQMKDVEMAYQTFFNLKNAELQLKIAKDVDIKKKIYYVMVFDNCTFYFDKKINKE